MKLTDNKVSKPKEITKAKVLPKIDRKAFYVGLRSSFKSLKTLSQSQVDSINCILDYYEANYTDKRWLAYVLATVYHETAGTMLPIEEYGKGKGRKYGTKTKMNGKPYTSPNKLYYGRGYAQLTWYENYDKMGRLIGVDLLNHPEKMLEPETSANVLWIGMVDGLFTGVGLPRYFSPLVEDVLNARRTVNGTDKASLIASYYSKMLWLI